MTERSSPPRPRKPRGAYAKTQRTKEAILDAALEVFAESGYRSGSIRDIAQRVGMSEAGLLHHFPSKSILLANVLEHRDENSRVLVPIERENGLITLRGLVELARYNASIPGVVELYCILSAEATSPEHPAHDYFVRRYEWTRNNIVRAFESIQKMGRLRPGVTPYHAGVGTTAMMDGLQVQWLLDRASIDMATELCTYLETLVDVDLMLLPAPHSAESRLLLGISGQSDNDSVETSDEDLLPAG